MTTILTNNERIENLMGFGYAEREAAFLCMAALNGGFFVRRQFCQFIGSGAGGADATLVEKLLAKRHGTAIFGCQKAMIYHISARPFYKVIRQENNRNRRMRPPVSVKNRLMGLDYILDHQGHRYFATEEEKIAYFTGTFGIDPAEFPEKPFRSPNAEESTSRFFVDKYPIYIRDGPSSPPALCFCYIDEGVATLSRFGGYLDQYRRLFSRLPGFEVIYVSASRNLFWEAERRFTAFVSGQSTVHSVNLNTLNLTRLMQYFEDRQLYEAGPDQSFDRVKLIRFRDDREAFTGAFFESLYLQWKAGGTEAVQAALAPKESTTRSLNGLFSTYLLRHNYDLFGTSSNAKDA